MNRRDRHTRYGWMFFLATMLLLAIVIVVFWSTPSRGATCSDTLYYRVEVAPDVSRHNVLPDTVLVVLTNQGSHLPDSIVATVFPFLDSIPYCADSVDLVYWYFSFSGDWAFAIPGAVPGKANPVDLTSDSVFVKGGIIDTVYYVVAGNVSSLGDGSDTLHIVAYDTAAAVAVEGATVTILNQAGTPIYIRNTDGSGYALAILVDGDFYTMLGYGAGVTWHLDTFTHTAGATDTLVGYSISEPAAASSPQWVTAYMDFGTAFMDTATGAAISAQELEITCRFVAEGRVSCSTWAIVPESQTKKPNASGRVEFYIMVNNDCTPAGSYYELSYRSRRGRAQFEGIIKTFVVDSTPDPLNIINATEWWQ